MRSKKLNGTVIVTYRCNARCNMCSRYKAPSRPCLLYTSDVYKRQALVAAGVPGCDTGLLATLEVASKS